MVETLVPILDPNNICSYDPSVGGQDNWSDNWAPNTSNIMSYSLRDCRNYFSPLQVGIMYYNINGIGINNPTFHIISGPDALCYNQTATYSVNSLPGVTNYFWELPSSMSFVPTSIGTVGSVGGQGTTTIRVKANNGSGGIIKVTPNCGSKPTTADIINLGDIQIDGYDQACPNYTYTYTAPFISTASYSWSITNGSIQGSSNNRQVQIKMDQNSNPSTLHLQITNVCNYTINSYKTILHGDPPPPALQCITVGKEAPTAEPMQKERVPIIEYGDMLLYPNPASTEVTIIAPTKGYFNLSIYNTMGQSMYEESIEIKDKQTINVNAFPDGVYYVRLEGEVGTSTKKLILKK